eukprot:CAMPEP_0179416794 /NCGR_PEP_ID=MMETSP0799-20121207/6995_1 /TAXON_ID=46947 /ORGANISM="Geminigera cryophila, Strain CCMP2564" /LENGTH=185 /DNA_ID=CAMNT_0021189703 /DNA_START=342 /DNA_END=899 /DNA_ORIENTATION=-
MGCERGDADGCYALSKLQILKRVPGGDEAAFNNSYTACRMGQVQACCQTGLMFFQGVGCKPDMGKGLTVLLNTCNQLEHGLSCFQAARVVSNLADNGVHIARGERDGAPEGPQKEDRDLATQQMLRTLLRKGCAFKNEDACKHLADFEKEFPEPAGTTSEPSISLPSSFAPTTTTPTVGAKEEHE